MRPHLRVEEGEQAESPAATRARSHAHAAAAAGAAGTQKELGGLGRERDGGREHFGYLGGHTPSQPASQQQQQQQQQQAGRRRDADRHDDTHAPPLARASLGGHSYGSHGSHGSNHSLGSHGLGRQGDVSDYFGESRHDRLPASRSGVSVRVSHNPPHGRRSCVERAPLTHGGGAGVHSQEGPTPSFVERNRKVGGGLPAGRRR
jgi:hypothetical protein